jgi:nucleotide-binding universal stress UspA family protein
MHRAVAERAHVLRVPAAISWHPGCRSVRVMRFHKILCPIDFSPGSKAAVRTAIRIANDHDAELVLVHALHLPAAAELGASLMGELAVEAEQFLVDAVREAERLGGKRVSSRLLEGVPWSAIVTLLEDDPSYDLAILGTHGRTGIPRVFLGSVTEKVLRHAPCSVLAVRPGNEATPYAHVMCPIDFSVDAEHATQIAARLVEPTGRITLVHVTELPVAYFGDRPVTDVVRDLEARSSELSEKAAVLLRQKVTQPVTAKTREGRFPGAQLLHEIDEDRSIDLVVMGSHGRTGISRALLGSVAEKIVRHARCPVLVARRRSVTN